MGENILEEKYQYLRNVNEVFEELKTSKFGLSEAEAEERLKTEGQNIISKSERKNIINQIAGEFNNVLIYILFVSSIISLLSDHFIEFLAIIIIILMTVFISFIQRKRADKAVEELSKLTPKKVFVLRDGKKKEISAEQLVNGDIVFLERGMQVPADLRIIESNSLTANESILTGESNTKPKTAERIKHQCEIQDRDNMVFGGTGIVLGSGKGVVVDKGIKSEIGKISETLKKIGVEKSPLQKKIDKLSSRISIIVIVVAILFMVLLLVRNINLLEASLLVGAILVSGIPESFPLALTLALSSGVKRMAKQNAIVKNLGSVETLGTTTVICTDKTGTLTQNKMVVQKILLGVEKEYDVKGKGYEPLAEFFFKGKKINGNQIKNQEFFKAITLCNNAELEFEDGDWKLRGEPTEGALLALVKSVGIDDEELREENKRNVEKPFDPAHKYMITVNSGKAYLKGAIEKILEKSSFIRKSGKLVKMSSNHKKKIISQVHKYSSEGLRVLAVASKKTNAKEKDSNSLKSGFIFEGLVAINDPLRPDVADSIKICREAGIRVMMVTGDHKITAENIGKSLGLINSDEDLVLLGSDIDSMSDNDLDKTIDKVVIFARTTPEHKLRIVSSLKRKGEVVAMTGDGVNDAPALKKADIGVSMGAIGTDVAREASDMILADDNFSTIVHAVREGRTIYSNIRRFIFYLLTGNFTEVSLIVFSIILGMITPLTALMVLFINVVTSTFPAMALSVEPTHLKVMTQKPRNPNERLLSRYILLKIIVLVPLLMFGTFSLFAWELNYSGGSIEKARTLAFAAIIMFELMHSLNARSLHSTIFNKNFFKNKYLFISLATSILLMILVIHTSLGQKIFKTVSLGMGEWIIVIIVSSLVLVVSEVIKLLIKSEFKEQMNLRGLKVNYE